MLGQNRWLVTYHGSSVLRQPAQQLQLLAEHALERLQLLDVGLRNGGDDADLGSRDLGEGADLSRLVGPHLQDHHLDIVGSVQQGQRKSHAVVEVAAGGV